MSIAQKVIKYLAFSFDIFLMITIASAIVTAGYGLLKATGLIDNTVKSSITYHSIYDSYLDINIKYANLKVVSGDTLKVENNNDKIYISQESNKLIIEDSSNIFTKNKDIEVVVYIPNIKFDIVSINTGYGKLKVDGLTTKKLKLNLGAGSAKLKNIITDNTDVSTGTGSVSINKSILNNAKLDLGIGSINIDANITGESHINCGIGSVNLNLTGTEYDYTIDVEKGIGSINLDGHKVEKGSNFISGGGPNYIKIEGGIGSINVNTKDSLEIR